MVAVQAVTLLALVKQVVVWAFWDKVPMELAELQIRAVAAVLEEQTVAPLAVHMAAAAVVDFTNHRVFLTVGLPAVLVQSVLFGPVQLVSSHQLVQEICKWNYLFVLQTA